MKKKNVLHLVAVKLSDQQLVVLDAEVAARQREETSEELRITRSSVLRHALMELARRRRVA